MIDDNEKQRALAKARLEAAREEVRLHKEALKSIPKGKGGRPKRSTNFTPLAIANNKAVHEVLAAKKEYREHTGAGNVPTIETEKYIKKACERHPPANEVTVTNRVKRKDFKRLRSKATSQNL
jgi:hypothetical protein